MPPPRTPLTSQRKQQIMRWRHLSVGLDVSWTEKKNSALTLSRQHCCLELYTSISATRNELPVTDRIDPNLREDQLLESFFVYLLSDYQLNQSTIEIDRHGAKLSTDVALRGCVHNRSDRSDLFGLFIRIHSRNLCSLQIF